MKYFILDENKNIIPATVEEWEESLNNNIRSWEVKFDLFSKNKNNYVSTIFVGIKDYLFSTIAIKNGKVVFSESSNTWKGAEEKHLKVVERYMPEYLFNFN